MFTGTGVISFFEQVKSPSKALSFTANMASTAFS